MCPLSKIDLACSNPQLKTLDGGVEHWEKQRGWGGEKNTLYGGGGYKRKKNMGYGVVFKKNTLGMGFWKSNENHWWGGGGGGGA